MPDTSHLYLHERAQLFGFWKGSSPNLTRAVVLAAFELSCYDEIKKQLKRTGIIEEGTISGVFLTSLGSGFVASCVSNPIDVIKSRVMGQPVDAEGKGKLYKGMIVSHASFWQKLAARSLSTSISWH